MYCSGFGSVTILNYLLMQAQNLETIEFYDLRLYGTDAAFEKLARNLKSHPNLTQLNSFYLSIVAHNASQTRPIVISPLHHLDLQALLLRM